MCREALLCLRVGFAHDLPLLQGDFIVKYSFMLKLFGRVQCQFTAESAIEVLLNILEKRHWFMRGNSFGDPLTICVWANNYSEYAPKHLQGMAAMHQIATLPLPCPPESDDWDDFAARAWALAENVGKPLPADEPIPF